MSFVWFEQLPKILKKAIYKKVNSPILYENNERMKIFSTQAGSKLFLIQNLNAMRNSNYEFQLSWKTP